jgi:hypothetical protein
VDETLFWTKVAALGQVGGAVATFAAVVVALWIARSERRAHIKAHAGLRITFAGDGSPFEDAISIGITNDGLRSVRISSIGWRTGWLRHGPKWLKFQYAYQKFDHPVSLMTGPGPPFDLGPGQERTLLLPTSTHQERTELRDTFFNRRLPFRKTVSPTKICVLISIVAAKPSVTRVERALESFLATGVMADGADKANKAADRRSGRA